jgi:hypothetical protein
VILDSLDLFILKEILDNKECSTWDIAKKYNWNHQTKDLDYTGKSILVGRRLYRMQKEEILKIEKSGIKNVFILFGEKVKKEKHKFPNGRREAILVQDKDEKWMAIQL